jgi:hypothetical protein
MRQHGRAVGGAILVKFGDGALLMNGGCPAALLKDAAGPVLYASAIQWALDQGLEYLDMGRSQPGGGTERFKRRFGAAITSLHSYGIERLEIDRPLGRFGRAIWRNLPLGFSNALSPAIRHFIPFG